ncbi:MAG: hypothetical protein AAF202_07060 [Pseudomonadota bacterium]
MRKLTLLLALATAFQAQASRDYFTIENVTEAQNSLEFHDSSQMVLPVTAVADGYVKMHTFSSKAEPESWVLFEVGRNLPELGCFALYDVAVKGIGLQISSVKHLRSNVDEGSDTIRIDYSVSEADPGMTRVFEYREVKITPVDGSCENDVQGF